MLRPATPARAGLTQADLASIGITPPPDARVPLDLPFRDEAGRPTTLATVAGGRPLVLLLADFTCHTLCGAAVTVAGSEIEGLPLRAGQDYTAAVVGLDPKDGPAEARALKAKELAAYPKAAATLAFLSGDQPAVDTVTHGLGYRYVYDKEHDQFAHPAGLVVLTADGRVSRVLAGLDGSVDDLRLALVEAGGGRVGTLADQVRLLCYGFDPVRGVYTPAVMGILRVCGAADGAGARRRHPAAAPPHAPDRRTRGGAMNDQPLPSFEFFPVQASVEASRTDLIYYSFVGISVLISLIVVALIVTFSFRYRRGTKAKRGPMPMLVRHEFEVGWISATFFAFLFMFWWGASNTLSAWLPPEDALEIHVVAKQWMWKTAAPATAPARSTSCTCPSAGRCA